MGLHWMAKGLTLGLLSDTRRTASSYVTSTLRYRVSVSRTIPSTMMENLLLVSGRPPHRHPDQPRRSGANPPLSLGRVPAACHPLPHPPRCMSTRQTSPPYLRMKRTESASHGRSTRLRPNRTGRAEIPLSRLHPLRSPRSNTNSRWTSARFRGSTLMSSSSTAKVYTRSTPAQKSVRQKRAARSDF